MTKKIGRNSICPCGSGKKYKKCCIYSGINFNLKSNDTSYSDTIKFIKNNNSKNLLDFVIGLQLQPDNHGKNIRIDELSKLVVANLNSNLNFNFNLFKSLIDKDFSYNSMEDIPVNLFCENILFYGGNYTIFPGIHDYAVKTFETLIESIFIETNSLPKLFVKEAFDGVKLILELGQILSNSFKVSGNIKGSCDNSEIYHSFERISTSFSIDKINEICSRCDIDKKTIDYFILNTNDEDLKNDDPNLNPLLCRPIILYENRYYFVLISNQINSLNEYILSLSNKHNCNKELLEVYHNRTWKEQLRVSGKMNWKLIDAKLPINKYKKNLKERTYQIDTNRISYVAYFHFDELANVSKENLSKPKEFDFDINQRVNEVINYLKGISDFKSFKFLTVITFEAMGRKIAFTFEEGIINEARIAIAIFQFNMLAVFESWDNLSLWKFSQSYKYFSKNTFTGLSDFVDIYSLYINNDESFYFEDNYKPTYLSTPPGEGSEIIKNGKLQNNIHGILYRKKDKSIYIPSRKCVDYAPLYKPLGMFKDYQLCLQVFQFPLWIVNSQKFNSKIPMDVKYFGEALGFWLYKLESEITDYLTPNISGCLEVNFVLEDSIFNKKQIFDVDDSRENNPFEYSLVNGKLIFFIPLSRIESFYGKDNKGEREMMNAMLSAFNLLEGVNISKDDIELIIDRQMPLGNAKMILMSDSMKNPIVDSRWLIEPKYISSYELERIHDEILKSIEEKKEIPLEITENREKKDFFNFSVNILLETLKIEINNFDYQGLLSLLLELNESLIWKREYDKIIIPAKIFCLGSSDEKLKEIKNKSEKLVSTSLSTRCLIEYLVVEQTKGNVIPGFDDIDRFLAIMNQIVNYGFMSDAIHFELDSPSVEKLKSGRIGFTSELFDNDMPAFASEYVKEQVEVYVNGFSNKLKIFQVPLSKEVSDNSKPSKELKKIDDSFYKDWGISYSNINIFCFYCYLICRDTKKSTIVILETELIQNIVSKCELTEDEVTSAINHFSLSTRPSYLIAPEGFHTNEVLPWKYNREFSLVRRFMIKYKSKSGNMLLQWGMRGAISSFDQLQYLLYEGKLKNGGKNIDKLLGGFREKKGKRFRNEVKDWLKTNKSLTVIDYEVDISPKGHLEADKKYGDIDILVYDSIRRIVFSLECKNTNKAKNIHELKKELDNYIGRDGQKGMIQKHVERHTWAINNMDKICNFLNLSNDIKIVSYLITSEVIPTQFIGKHKIQIPIISFSELKTEGLSKFS